MIWVLWRWSAARDQWEYETEVTEERKGFALRSARRRNPLGSRFKWRVKGEDPPKRFRHRIAKQVTE